jgi:hypothetical protein
VFTPGALALREFVAQAGEIAQSPQTFTGHGRVTALRRRGPRE